MATDFTATVSKQQTNSSTFRFCINKLYDIIYLLIGTCIGLIIRHSNIERQLKRLPTRVFWVKNDGFLWIPIFLSVIQVWRHLLYIFTLYLVSYTPNWAAWVFTGYESHNSAWLKINMIVISFIYRRDFKV